MGTLDAERKEYIGNPKIFADAFNYILFNGEPVIKPEELSPEDPTEIAVIDGKGKPTTLQKQRDLLKTWSVMSDDDFTYVLLGGELQSGIHNAIAVKNMLYDAVNYSSQVNSFANKHRQAKDLTGDSFLSGMSRNDKLKPVITVVIYLGQDEWDAPVSLHEMLDTKDSRILKFVPDYRINLIEPHRMSDEEFDKFQTGFGMVLKAIKYQKSGAVEKLANYRMIDIESAIFIKRVLSFDLNIGEPNEKGEIDMCKAVEEYTLRTKVLTAIESFRMLITDENEIIKLVCKQCNVTPEYVKQLMKSAA